MNILFKLLGLQKILSLTRFTNNSMIFDIMFLYEFMLIAFKLSCATLVFIPKRLCFNETNLINEYYALKSKQVNRWTKPPDCYVNDFLCLYFKWFCYKLFMKYFIRLWYIRYNVINTIYEYSNVNSWNDYSFLHMT